MNLQQIVNNLEQQKSGCIVWTRGKDTRGYGYVNYDKKVQRVHRLIFKLKYRITNLPKWAYVCHSCDNPACCNLDHLFLGNAKINTVDMVNKGRDAWIKTIYREK